MNKYRKSLITGMSLWLMFIATPAFAALDVEFEATPLFIEATIMPGDTVIRTIEVQNTGTSTESVEILVENFFTGGLADSLQVTIASPGTTHFTGSLSTFFAQGRVELGNMGPGIEKIFSVTVAFPATAQNELMKTQTGFDLIIGFLGGERVSDTPLRAGGSGGGGSAPLRLFNEAVETVFVASSTALITWNSNQDATSYLLCGNISSGREFSLTATAPLFGYEFFIPEVDLNTKDHAALVAGAPNQSYECRPAGRRTLSGAFTVGQPVIFSFPGPIVLGAATSSPIFPFAQGLLTETPVPAGEVLGDQISVWPLGGSALGMGGAQLSVLGIPFVLFVFILILWNGRRRVS